MANCPYCGATATVTDTADEGRVLELVAPTGRLRHRLAAIPAETPYRFRPCAGECLPAENPNSHAVTMTIAPDGAVVWKGPEV